MSFKENLTLERLPDAMSYLIGEVGDIKKALHKPEPKPGETYLTPEQLSEKLHVSLVTLWSWDKKGITVPLRIGNKKLYRLSDIEKILSNA